MIRWGVGRFSAAVVVVSVVSLLSGCALLDPPAHSAATPTETTDPDPAPIAQQLPDVLVAGQTIGTGRLSVVEHEPMGGPAAEHPLTGVVRVVVGEDRGIRVRIRPDDPAGADLTGKELLMSGDRYDGRPENIQHEFLFGLTPDQDASGTDGELVFRLALDSPSAGDPSFLHSIRETPAGDARVVAAASITWTLPSSFPGVAAVDGGSMTNARGRTVVEDGALAYYVPSRADTIYAVSRRFGLSEAELVWLNPELLIGPEPELRAGIGVNLDPQRR